MSIATYKAFGRGSISSVADDIQANYDTLKALSALPLGQYCFHPNADIHEDFITWNSHTHEDGSLANGSIKDRHFNRTHDDDDHSRVLFAHAPKTLFLFGEFDTPGYFDFDHGGVEHSFDIDFASYSYAKVSFPAGTVPVVFASQKFGGTAFDPGTNPWSGHVTSISSFGFTYTFLFHEDDLTGIFNKTNTITFIAVGIAPGVILPLGE